jgi:protein-S-isoprenylcysteine O-methyltransferase Ste14
VGIILDVCHGLIVLLWAIFLLYWAIAALFVKSGFRQTLSGRSLLFRFVLILAILLTVELVRRSPELRELHLDVLRSVPLAIAGAVITAAGAILSFTARAAIGRNWGTPGTQRTDTELVTSGPYRLVRHPIYSGVLLMLIGTALAMIPLWWLVAAAAGVYFLYSARAEERFMTERFPDQYPAYRSRTKMLLPFVL